jgi:hypothetical protein
MEEEMLSPFHYYGVTDLLMICQLTDFLSSFQKRVKGISEQALNGYNKGLIFCSRKKKIELSSLFNLNGRSCLNGDSKRKEQKRLKD